MKVALPDKSSPKRILIAPIPLERPEKKKLSKDEYLTFKLRNNPAEADSTTYESTVPFFSEGNPEETLDFVTDIRRVINGQNITTGPARYTVMRRLLKGDALAAFNTAATAAGNETVANFDVATNALVMHMFPNRALITQKRCMRRFFRKPVSMTMRAYMARLTEINEKLTRFPPFAANQALPNEELLDIGEYGIPNAWQREMIRQDYDPIENTVSDLVNFCERMERTEDKPEQKKRSRENDDKVNRKKSKPSGMWCEY